jgi:glycosyltransferase involved in cell wall biosynthesis
MTDSFETGGTERQFSALARSLDPASFRVHLGCIRKQGAFLDGLADVQQFSLGGSLYRWQSMRTRFRLRRHLRECEIAVAHAFDFYSNLTLIPAARMAGTPVVIGSQRQLGDLLTGPQFWAQQAVFHLCDAVVCNSRAAADRLVKNGLPERKIAVIGNGLPPQAFAEAAPALPRRPGLLCVGMIARMNAPYKNHMGFLRAAARLSAKFHNLEFLLVGDGPLRTEIESEVKRLGLGDRMVFLGDRRDIPAVLASMDISVNPSASESQSNVVLESMAAGVPVVATNVGGNPELLSGKRGVLVPEGSDEAIADGLENLLRNPGLRAEIGDRARHFARANFSIEGMRERYESLYTELLSKKHRPRTPVASRRSTPAKCRVALVAPTLRYVGGQAVQADLFLRNWRNDPNVEAIFIPVDPPLPRWLQWVERIPGLRTIVREPIYLLALWRGLKDADIAHIFSASYWSFLLAPAPALLVSRFRGAKTLINYRSGEARDHLRRFRTARPLLAAADMLVVPSGYLVDVFREFDLPAKVVPNVVDLTQFSFRVRRPLRPHLVCTRGFHAYYSVDVVVRAFAEVLIEFPEARLDLVGGGPQEGEIKGLVAKLGLARVNFCGVATRQDIGRFYSQADIFVNASCLDNMPVSVIEAFAAGTPVVSTAPESMPYLVDHERTGLLSPVGDEHALAENVIRLLREPDLAQRIAVNAYEESQRYSWPAVREQWIEVYRSLSSGSRRLEPELSATQ